MSDPDLIESVCTILARVLICEALDVVCVDLPLKTVGA